MELIVMMEVFVLPCLAPGIYLGRRVSKDLCRFLPPGNSPTLQSHCQERAARPWIRCSWHRTWLLELLPAYCLTEARYTRVAW